MGASVTSHHAKLDPEHWIENHGDHLFRFALKHVQAREVAEDCVQEALVAALKARDRYRGDSSERTWLISILKRKIADHFRRTAKDVILESRREPEDVFFRASGRWKPKPHKWTLSDTDPADSEDLRRALRTCIGRLPSNLHSAFILRELHGMDSEKCSEHLSVSATNLSTMVYRARLLLRHCLETGWFRATKSGRRA